MNLLETMVERWSSHDARPLFKGRLIDADGCCCAQGDVLRICGWADSQLRQTEQPEADREVARRLGISLAHSILLRLINDKEDGCPQDVLARPERVLGNKAHLVLAFWMRLDAMSVDQWAAIRAAAKAAGARAAAWAAGAAARDAGAAARDAARDAAGAAAWAAGAAAYAATEAAWAAGVAAYAAAGAAAGASNEIQGAARLSDFFFLPMFGIAHPSDLDKPMDSPRSP